jgi:thiol-disulfide isomerase/thioredoxin
VRFPEDFKSHLVLVNFWATWCAPCRLEEPFLVQAYEKYHERGLQVVGVTLDAFQRTPPARVAEFLNEQHIPWPQVYTDGPAIAARYGVSAIPAAFLVDADSGKILASGEDLRGDALLKTLGKCLGAPRRP